MLKFLENSQWGSRRGRGGWGRHEKGWGKGVSGVIVELREVSILKDMGYGSGRGR